MFCRCAIEGGNREVLCQMVADDYGYYDFAENSNLFEINDGSWVLLGVDKNISKNKDAYLALIRFSLVGNLWTTSVSSLRIPYITMGYSSSSWSFDSGYGLIACSDDHSRSLYTKEGMEIWESVSNHVNLIRVLPDDILSSDVWWIRRTGENTETVEMISGEDYLWALKVKTGIIENDEIQIAEQWISNNVIEGEEPLPNYYDYDAYIKEKEDFSCLRANCVCMSPDGYYALISAGSDKQYNIYIVNLETMAIKPVKTPDSMNTVFIGTVFGADYLPGIVWNEDGTIMILSTDGIDYETVKISTFRLETALTE